MTLRKSWLGASTLFTLLVIAACARNTVAQNTFPTPSGNVGIGTTDPGRLLTVFASSGAPAIQVTTESGSSTGLTLQSDASNRYVWSYGGYPLLLGTNGSEKLRITSGGDVGIGTTSPGTKLEVSGQGRFNPGASFSAIDTGWAAAFGYSTGNWGVRLGATGNQGVIQVAQNTTAYDLAVQPYGGNVGIGTTSPGTKFEVSGQGRFNPGASFSAIDTGWAAAFGYSGGNWGVRLGATGGQGVIQVAQGTTAYDLAVQPYGGNVGIGTTDPTAPLHVQFGGDKALKVETTTASTGIARIQAMGPGTQAQVGLEWREDVSGGMALIQTGKSNNNPNLGILSGNVGIGTTTPGTKLEVSGQGRFNPGASFSAIDTGWAAAFGYSGANWGVRLGATGGQGVIQVAQGTTAYDLAVQPYGGNVGIGTNNPGSYKLNVNGDTNVAGNLNIVANGASAGNIVAAGTISAKYQDVAEWVPSSEQLAAGTVVVLDSTKSNQVISSSQSYDTRVAGVISAQPGISLGEKGDGKVLVATTGRVKVKVDASKGPIHIGDLLVTSDVPGVAMKSEAVNLGGVQFHRPGTLIGKALEPLEKGKGEILVLLSLQ